MKFAYIYLLICVLDLVAGIYFPAGRLLTSTFPAVSLLFLYINKLPRQHGLVLSGLTFGVLSSVLSSFYMTSLYNYILIANTLMFITYGLYVYQFKEKAWAKTQILALIVPICILISSAYWIMYQEISNIYIFLVFVITGLLFQYTGINFPRIRNKISKIAIGSLMIGVAKYLEALNVFEFKIELLHNMLLILFYLGQYILVTEIIKDALIYFNASKKISKL